MRIVIIGNGPAAIKALQAIATCGDASKRPEITVISAEKTPAYSPMFLTDYLSGNLKETELLLRDNYGLPVKRILVAKVIEVKDNQNKVIIGDGKEIHYDKLLIASGASPVKPPIKGIDKKEVYFFNRLSDARKMSHRLQKVRNAIVVGAGAIGIEIAVTLNKMRKEVIVIEALNQILPEMLDDDLSQYLKKELSHRGIKFWLGMAVSEVTGNRQASGVVIGNREIHGDLVIIAIGVKPNVDFLASSCVNLGRGILVNERMQTNIANIYAAGDVAESIDPYGGHELVFNYYNAIDQGWIAGCNLIGIEKAYEASPGLSVLKGMEFPVCCIGRKYSKNGYEILVHTDEKRGIFEKIFIRDSHIDCYQALGIWDKIGQMYGYIKCRKDISQVKETLLAPFSTQIYRSLSIW